MRTHSVLAVVLTLALAGVMFFAVSPQNNPASVAVAPSGNQVFIVTPGRTRTPTPGGPTATPTNTPVVPSATPSNTPVVPSATPTNTPVPPSATPSNTPTNTPVPPSATPSNTPTNTPVPPSATPSNTPTNTPVLPSPTPSNTPTNTPVLPSATPSNTPTNTPVLPSATPSNTATNTPVLPSATPSNTPTNTPVLPSATPTSTSDLATATLTNTPGGPTETPAGPTNTPGGPTNTPAGPTNTPQTPGDPSPTPGSDPDPGTPTNTPPATEVPPTFIAPTGEPSTPVATLSPVCNTLGLPTLSVSAAPAQALPGTEAAFTLRVSNPNAFNIDLVDVSAVFPAVATYVSATSTQGTPVYQAANNSVTLALGTLAAGQSVDLTIRVVLAASAPASSQVSVAAGVAVNGLTCVQAGGAVTITPAGIPVTGGGPGWEEIRMMLFTGLLLVAGSVWAGRQLLRRKLARH